MRRDEWSRNCTQRFSNTWVNSQARAEDLECWGPTQGPSTFLYNYWMTTDSPLHELQKEVAKCTVSILYKPLEAEIDYSLPDFPLRLPTETFMVTHDKNSDPFEWADTCLQYFKDLNVCVLVPGTRFDKYGTRYGRGAGWYDRFLSKLPKNWLRIGVVDKSGFSNLRLERRSWDEPVDWVLTYNKTTWKAYNTRDQL